MPTIVMCLFSQLFFVNFIMKDVILIIKDSYSYFLVNESGERFG